MTIRRRLTISYFAILGLLGVNLVSYLWSDLKRAATFEELRRAISRQTLIASVRQELNDTQRQVTLVSQMMVEAGRSEATPEEIAQFNGRLDRMAGKIDQLRSLTDAGGKA